jgi:hypothetical protein
MKKAILLTILLCLTIWSCGSKKETTTQTVTITKIDTVKVEKIVEKEVVKTEKVVDTFEIKVPCDEKGQIKDFDRKIKTSAGMVHVYSKNGKIFAKLIIEATENGKSTTTEKEKKTSINQKDKDKSSEIIITKYKERMWLWYWFGASIIYIIYRLKKYFSPIG